MTDAKYKGFIGGVIIALLGLYMLYFDIIVGLLSVVIGVGLAALSLKDDLFHRKY